MLTPWKKSYDQHKQHMKKQRHYFANKGPSCQSYAFSSSHVWMWEMDSKESWALKNWCFWTVVLEKTLESPLGCKESNQYILKEISPDLLIRIPPCIKLMQKLKLQYFGYLIERIDLLKNILMLGGLKVGGEGDDRGWDGWMASLTRWTWAWVSSGSWWWIGKPDMLQFIGLQRVGHDWATELNCLQKLILLIKFHFN